MKKTNPSNHTSPTLVIGSTGKTGRRVVQRLRKRGVEVRSGSRSSQPPFDWSDPTGWHAALEGVGSVYIAYHPDLAVPGASEAIERLTRIAETQGVERLVLLSGRGEPEAQHCEQIVLDSRIPSTVVRCAWFNQNFSESFMHGMVRSGVIALPTNGVREPFVDADDIADVATAALTEPHHAGEIYELTGPELLSFTDIARHLAEAIDRPVAFQQIPLDAFLDGAREQRMPESMIELLNYLFSTIMDGRNEHLADGVQRALGRTPRRFNNFARSTAQAGTWDD